MLNSNEKNLYDAVIVGGGPAGLTAALYLARARYRVIVVEKERFGGQITITDEVVNYPGVLRASGTEITETMRRQAESFGAEFLLAEATSLDLQGDIKRVKTTKGDLFCFAVLLATGANPRRLGFPGEDEFQGRGVAYCATCDGEFFSGKEVFVIGGGFAAAEESVFLTRYAKHVTILVRGNDFSCAPTVSEKAKTDPRIDVLYNTQVVQAGGDTALRYLRYRNSKTGEEAEFHADEGDTFGIFVFAGYVPATGLVQGIVDLNAQGYVITDDSQMTSADGLFAAGDVCVKELRQVATATGEAAQTATSMERYLKAAQERTGLTPKPPVARPVEDLSQAKAKADEKTSDPSASSNSLFTPDMISQLNTVFGRMERPLMLKLALDSRPVSSELEVYMEELAGLSDKLSLTRVTGDELAAFDTGELPCVRVCDEAGTWTGLAFHGVPGGHEFTSFVLGLYNAAGPGQPIDDADRAAIAAIEVPVEIKVLVGLSCTMCPDVVIAAQRIAAGNECVSADVYDINHFEAIKDRYQVMSVPCLVVSREGADEKVSFGKKNLAEVLSLIGV